MSRVTNDIITDIVPNYDLNMTTSSGTDYKLLPDIEFNVSSEKPFNMVNDNLQSYTYKQFIAPENINKQYVSQSYKPRSVETVDNKQFITPENINKQYVSQSYKPRNDKITENDKQFIAPKSPSKQHIFHNTLSSRSVYMNGQKLKMSYADYLKKIKNSLEKFP